MSGTLDDTLDRLTELEQVLSRFGDAVAASWADAERAFESLAGTWSDSVRGMLDVEHEAMRASMRALTQVDGPARLRFVRERHALLQAYLQQRS